MLKINKQNKTLALLVALMAVAPVAAPSKTTSEAAATIEVVKAEAKKVEKTFLDAVEQSLKHVEKEDLALNALGITAEEAKALKFTPFKPEVIALRSSSAKDAKKEFKAAVAKLREDVKNNPGKNTFSKLTADEQRKWTAAFNALGVKLEAGKEFSFDKTSEKVHSKAFSEIAQTQDLNKAYAVGLVSKMFVTTTSRKDATFNAEEVQKAVLKLVNAAKNDADKKKALIGRFVTDVKEVEAILAKGLVEEPATFLGLLKDGKFAGEFLKKCINSVSVLDDKGNVKADLKQEAAATFFKANMKKFATDEKAEAILAKLSADELKGLGITSGKLDELPRMHKRAVYMWQGSRPGYKYGVPATVAAAAVLAVALTGAYKLSTGFRKFIQDIIGSEQAAANDVDAATTAQE